MPYQPLYNFNNLDPDGEWILTIHDNQAGNTGSLQAWGIKPMFEKMVMVEEPGTPGAGQRILLSQNIPNPFSGTTKIFWTSKVSGKTTLKIYNISGQEVETLVQKSLPKGEFSVEFDRSGLPTGVYYYKLQVGDTMLAKKCIIM
jgi:hypothetical protein